MREMKLSSYFVLSTFLAVGNLAHAFITYEQFYPAVIHLSGDKLSRVILYNFAFVLFLGFSLGTLRFFIGTLRDLEVEQLIDTGRGFLADTILFLVFYSPTVDGKEVDTPYLVQFICRIIFMKVFHLIVQIRVSHMFEVGLPRFWVNIKLFSLMTVLLLYDILTLKVYYPLATRNSTFYAWIVFEALSMAVMLIATFFKYLMHIIDLRLENGWPAKSAYLFYVDLIGDVANMTLFLIFMMACVFQNPSRLPVYMMADVLQVARQLTMRLKAFKKYRAITANMDQKFPNATAEELEKADSCIICRDTLWEGSKKLPCSHVFHLDCLKNWVVMQQCCPTCRADIPANPTPPPGNPAAAPPAAPPPGAAGAADGAAPPAGAAAAPFQNQAQPPAAAAPRATIPEVLRGAAADFATTTTRVTGGALPPEFESFFTNINQSQQPAADELGMSMSDIVTGMKHAQKMAIYMRKQQEFWMKQVEQLTTAAGGDPDSMVGVDIPGLPSLPIRFNLDIDPKGPTAPVKTTGEKTRNTTITPVTPSAASAQPPSTIRQDASPNASVGSCDTSNATGYERRDTSVNLSAAKSSVAEIKVASSTSLLVDVSTDAVQHDNEKTDRTSNGMKDEAEQMAEVGMTTNGGGGDELQKLRELQRSKWSESKSKSSCNEDVRE